METARQHPAPRAQRALGDRIRLQALTLAAETVRVDFTGFTPTDALCCPTLNMAQEFVLRDAVLDRARAIEAPALLAVPEGPSLVGWFGGPTTSGVPKPYPHLIERGVTRWGGSFGPGQEF